MRKWIDRPHCVRRCVHVVSASWTLLPESMRHHDTTARRHTVMQGRPTVRGWLPNPIWHPILYAPMGTTDGLKSCLGWVDMHSDDIHCHVTCLGGETMLAGTRGMGIWKTKTLIGAHDMTCLLSNLSEPHESLFGDSGTTISRSDEVDVDAVPGRGF